MKLGIIGACGRMGRLIVDRVKKEKDMELVFAIDTVVCGKHIENNVSREKLNRVDVVVDFSSPEATLNYIKIINAAWVIGTTGFNEEDLAELKKASKNMPILLSFNMSQGINILKRLVRSAAKLLNDYDIDIVEFHHNKKNDAPSGTAKMLYSEIDKYGSYQRIYGRKGKGLRKDKEIGIYAIRAGSIPGEHYIYFNGPGERIVLSHTAYSREPFVEGTIKAIRFINSKEKGFYTMDDVFKQM